MKVIVLGGGLVGGPMAEDLSTDKDMEVWVADRSDNILKKFASSPDIKTIQQDLSDSRALLELVQKFDMVLSAVPGFMGFATLKTIIESGRNVVDIAFCPEDVLSLDHLAREKNVTAVVDCGVAPGMSNMLTGYGYHLLDQAQKAVIYVGGLPLVRHQPWEYKAVFSPVDVIEEYVRPAFLVEDGKVVEKPALSDPEMIDFPRVGTLEVFNTDGLRTLIKNLDIPDMKEKTMRYPGHIDKVRFLRDIGFFSEAPLMVQGREVRPIDLTAELLFPQWELKPGDVDLTIMRVMVSGIKNGKERAYVWDLFDQYDEKSGVHSMARTTGYTATSVIRLLREGLFDKKGIISPEIIGQDEKSVQFVLEKLKEKNIDYKLNIIEGKAQHTL